MDKVFATFRNGSVVLDQTVDWPEGTRLQLEPQGSLLPEQTINEPVSIIGIRESDWPETPEQKQAWLDWLNSIVPLDLSLEEVNRISTEYEAAKERNIESVRQQWTELERLF